jgi:ribose transport system permease protein
VIATILTVYVLSAVLASAAGLLLTGRLNGANPNNGLSYELDAISACVLGGASLFGARGSIVGTFLGVVLVNTLANGIDLINVDAHLQQVIEGALLILIVWLDQWRKQRVVAE